MNKMMVAVFNTEEDAYKGVDALEDLSKKEDIILYATAVLVKDAAGTVNIRQVAPEGPIGSAVGMLTGAMVGLLAGPVGAAIGASAGGLTGLLADAGNAGVNADFLDEVSEVLIPGKSALVAEIDEDWVTPVDTKIKNLGGSIFRRSRSMVIEDQIAAESEAFSKELKEIREELKETNEQNKATVKKTLDTVEKRLNAIGEKSKEKLDQISNETKAKIKTVQAHIKGANEAKKAKFEKRIAEIKTEEKIRSEKLRQARELVKEALAL